VSRNGGESSNAVGGHEPALPLTGERTLPGVPSENYWFRRHEATYEFVFGLLPDEPSTGVLAEVGAGEGYGADLLAQHARTVLALDYDELAIAHLARTYPRLRPVRANLAALPIADGTVDAVVSLQVIEHVWDHPEFVAECWRVLCPGGLLLLSTPNRLTFSPGLDTPVNPFHTHEFTAAELSSLIARAGFEAISVLGLHAGSRLRSLDAEHAASGGFAAAQLACPPDQWPADVRTSVASVCTADFEVAEEAVDESLDLILLARRP